MSRKYTILMLMIIMITSIALIQGAAIERCEYDFTYFDGCNICSCDLNYSVWSCSASWCDGVTIKPPPCLCKLAQCKQDASYFDGCNMCSCDLTDSAWQCEAVWCGDVIIKPPPCQCE